GRIETYLEEYDYGEETDPFEEELKKETDNIISLSKYKEAQLDESTYKYTTELWGEVSAGKGIESIVIREQIKTSVKCDFALRVKGDSMEPLYHDQQIIYIKQTPSVEQSQIAAVQVDDFIPAAYIKKVYIEGPKVRLVSLNPLYEDIILPAESIKILGKVIEF
ncbi:MAG TPA: hypothetical protein DC000_04145, partial [Clostridiales bacterium]|nr:hypothetical protein [Clostridiales bacterium]